MAAASRARASRRLASRVRKRRAVMIKAPPAVTRAPRLLSNRSRTSGGRAGEPATSKRSCTAVATLFTFCPPGPRLRMKRSASSSSGMVRPDVTCTMAVI